MSANGDSGSSSSSSSGSSNDAGSSGVDPDDDASAAARAHAGAGAGAGAGVVAARWRGRGRLWPGAQCASPNHALGAPHLLTFRCALGALPDGAPAAERAFEGAGAPPAGAAGGAALGGAPLACDICERDDMHVARAGASGAGAGSGSGVGGGRGFLRCGAPGCHHVECLACFAGAVGAARAAAAAKRARARPAAARPRVPAPLAAPAAPPAAPFAALCGLAYCDTGAPALAVAQGRLARALRAAPAPARAARAARAAARRSSLSHPRPRAVADAVERANAREDGSDEDEDEGDDEALGPLLQAAGAAPRASRARGGGGALDNEGARAPRLPSAEGASALLQAAARLAEAGCAAAFVGGSVGVDVPCLDLPPAHVGMAVVLSVRGGAQATQLAAAAFGAGDATGGRAPTFARQRFM